MCHGFQSLMCDRDLRGLFLESTVQNLVKLVGENFNSSIASQEDVLMVLPGTTTSSLIQQMVTLLCWEMLALEVGADQAVYTLGMVCFGLLTLWWVP